MGLEAAAVGLEAVVVVADSAEIANAAVGAAAVSGASDGSEVKGFGDEVSGDDNEFIAGLMRRLGLGAR